MTDSASWQGVACWRVLEFYSGIGGLRYSLEHAGVHAVVVEAFEINEVANDVYEHNFGHRPNQGNIQRLTVQQLDGYRADTWLLSPPCQPYTRQGLQKDVEDGRAKSFLHLLQNLSKMESPPGFVLVENVVGFECSVTHDCLLDVLQKAGYEVQEFILSPLQLGIPYSRPRYFCLAKRKPLLFSHEELNGSLRCRLGPLLETAKETIGCPEYVQDASQLPYKPEIQPKSMNEPELDPTVICHPVRDYLEAEPVEDLETGSLFLQSSHNLETQNAGGRECDSCPTAWEAGYLRRLGESDCDATESSGHQTIPEKWEDYMVPPSTVARWGDCFDIVTPESTRCCCFTKSYSRFAKGTGSFLAMKTVQSDLTGVPLSDLCLRYFTPREVANLHSFPRNFTFPPHVTLKQRYGLLGNSLSVAVVGCLLRYLFGSKSA